MEDTEHFRTDYFQLELLPYSLSATHFAFRQFVLVQDAITQQRVEQGIRPNEILVLKPEERDPMNFAVDSFLEAARRTQNALIPYLSKSFSKPNLPASMSYLVAKLERGRLTLPEPIASLLTAYWREHGNGLKSYRDLSQHYTLVTSEVRLFLNDQQQLYVYFALPRNPEVRSPTKLVWKPPVHAFLYMRRQLYKLIRLNFEITKMLLRPGSTTATYMQVPRDWIGREREGCRIPKEGELDGELNAFIQKLVKESEGVPSVFDVSGSQSS